MQNRATSASLFDIIPEAGKTMSISIPGDSFSGAIIPGATVPGAEEKSQHFRVPEQLRVPKLTLVTQARPPSARRRAVSRLANSTLLCITVAMMAAFLIVWSALMQYAAHLAG